MTRMSRDRKIIFVLLIALAVQVVLLLAHTGVIHLSGKSNVRGTPAGRVSEAHNHLRRRSLNSLVWENSQASEAVYYHDSILTLKGSTATLALDNATQVTLSENTLITIEPPDEHESGEIRLRFVRGSLEARNPYQHSRIQGESWSVDVKQGSQLELREAGEGVEVVLKSGQGSVQAGGTTGELKTGEVVRVNKSALDHLALDNSLQWLNPPPKRTYLHGEALPLQIEWKGEADALLIQTLGYPERLIGLRAGEHSHLADLSFGNHRLYLRKNGRTSEALDLQVWRAPLIHLLSPLPRNRVELGDNVRFLWQKSPEVEGFRLNISGAATKVKEERAVNEWNQTFSVEDDAQWFVEGVDRDGFAVPPLYRYPLFIRERPLPAPELKMPELRAPAAEEPPGPGAWLWSWIMPVAHAADFVGFQAVFSWEPVEGANLYVIEISESADFRNPVVDRMVKRPEFVWDKFTLSTFYWRVAAAHSGGRMGLFSEPVQIDFTPLKNNSKIAALNGVLIRKVAPKPVAVVAPPAPPPVPPAPAPAEAASEPEKPTVNENQKNWQPIVLWQPRYGMIQAYGSNSSASLRGAIPSSLGFELPFKISSDVLWLFDAAASYYSFAPDPRAKFPFQKDLNWLEYDVNLLRFRSPFGYGWSARQNMSLRRTDYETIVADTDLGFGPVVQWNIAVPRGDLNLRASLIFNRQGQVLVISPEWRGRIGSRFVTGFGVEAQGLVSLPDIGYSVQGYFTIGFPF